MNREYNSNLKLLNDLKIDTKTVDLGSYELIAPTCIVKNHSSWIIKNNLVEGQKNFHFDPSSEELCLSALNRATGSFLSAHHEIVQRETHKLKTTERRVHFECIVDSTERAYIYAYPEQSRFARVAVHKIPIGPIGKISQKHIDNACNELMLVERAYAAVAARCGLSKRTNRRIPLSLAEMKAAVGNTQSPVYPVRLSLTHFEQHKVRNYGKHTALALERHCVESSTTLINGVLYFIPENLSKTRNGWELNYFSESSEKYIKRLFNQDKNQANCWHLALKEYMRLLDTGEMVSNDKKIRNVPPHPTLKIKVKKVKAKTPNTKPAKVFYLITDMHATNPKGRTSLVKKYLGTLNTINQKTINSSITKLVGHWFWAQKTREKYGKKAMFSIEPPQCTRYYIPDSFKVPRITTKELKGSLASTITLGEVS
ncbi:hypothetical protein [Vibrio mediterranei]|uniref:hypothetical protein n=1 Tax=Vibrio mediterranei TaxID=689 RepID=UPI0040685EF1